MRLLCIIYVRHWSPKSWPTETLRKPTWGFWDANKNCPQGGDGFFTTIRAWKFVLLLNEIWILHKNNDINCGGNLKWPPPKGNGGTFIWKLYLGTVHWYERYFIFSTITPHFIIITNLLPASHPNDPTENELPCRVKKKIWGHRKCVKLHLCRNTQTFGRHDGVVQGPSILQILPPLPGTFSGMTKRVSRELVLWWLEELGRGPSKRDKALDLRTQQMGSPTCRLQASRP